MENSEIFKLYNNYINKNKINKRVKISVKLAGLILTVVGLSFGVYHAVNAKNANEDIEELTYKSYVLQDKLKNAESEEEKFYLEGEIEELKRIMQLKKSIKNISIVTSGASFVAGAGSYLLADKLKKLKEKETDKIGEEFYKKFIKEILIFKTREDKENFDNTIYFLVSEIANSQGETYKELSMKINSEEAFPEFNTKYTNYFKFLKKLDKQGKLSLNLKEIYDTLPKTFMDFMIYLDDHGISMVEFLQYPDDLIETIIEYFMELQVKKNKGTNTEENQKI